MNPATVEHNKLRYKLIEMVKRSPMLWDKKDKNYNKNRTQMSRKWDEIRKELNVDIATARRNWENLRHQYRRDLRRELNNKDFKSMWRFYKDMEFIRETVLPSVTGPKRQKKIKVNPEPKYKNDLPLNPQSTHWDKSEKTITIEANYASVNPLSPRESLDSYDSSQEDLTMSVSSNHSYEVIAKQEPDFEITMLEDPLIEEPPEAVNTNISYQEIPEELPSSSHKISQVSLDNVIDTSVEASTSKAQKITQTEADTNDEDYHFVMSILSSLRQVPQKRKFHLRLGIMNLIAKDLESDQ